MALKAKKPVEIVKRLKMFMFGESGVGKTRAAMQFPKGYFIDTEHGGENYADLLNESGSVYMQTTSIKEVMAQARELATTSHGYRTLVIDPITTVEADLITTSEDAIAKSFQAKKNMTADEAAWEARGDMRVWRDRDRDLKRLANYLYALDMNVIITAHAKEKFNPDGGKGPREVIFDAWKRWPYVFDLALEIQRRGKDVVGVVRKSRLKAFPDGEVFTFSYDAICDRYGRDIIEKSNDPLALATNEEVTRIKGLLTMLIMPDGWEARAFTKAGVNRWEDMPQDNVQKCIKAIEARIATGKPSQDEPEDDE